METPPCCSTNPRKEMRCAARSLWWPSKKIESPFAVGNGPLPSPSEWIPFMLLELVWDALVVLTVGA